MAFRRRLSITIRNGGAVTGRILALGAQSAMKQSTFANVSRSDSCDRMTETRPKRQLRALLPEHKADVGAGRVDAERGYTDASQ